MTGGLKILLVDDERPARKWLRQLLSAHADVQLVGEADGVKAAAELAHLQKPDVIFLDIQMPPDNGFDLLPLLCPTPHIVFVTAHDSFAIRAFEANALDYLLKPVHPERLAESLRRIRTSSHPIPPPQDPGQSPLRSNDLLPLQDRGTLRMVTVNEIAAIQAEAAFSRVWLYEQNPLLIWRRIREWDELLPKPPFARIHRSLLLNLDRVRSVDVKSRDEAHILVEGISPPLVVGRAASIRLRKLLQEKPRSRKINDAGSV